ncbi:MAG: hypothetical protein RR147_03815 [Oscillospiraceae bacterium]
MNELVQELCGCERENLTCTSTTSQYADVSVSLKLKPYAIVGKMSTECCGEPVIALRPCGSGSCQCEITITQTVCVRIPIEYGTEADIGETKTNCKKNCGCGDGGTSIPCR